MVNPLTKLVNTIKSKFFQKYTKSAIKTAVGFLSVNLVKFTGIELTQEQEIQLGVALTGAVFAVTNAVKHKFPKQFGWI